MIDDHLKSTTGRSGFRWKESLKNLKKRRFFRYVGRSVLLILSVCLLVVLIVFLIGKYLVDFNTFFWRDHRASLRQVRYPIVFSVRIIHRNDPGGPFRNMDAEI